MSFQSFSKKQYHPLTDDELRALAPSIFAESPHPSRSERYAYIPTSAIVTAMRGEGFLPVVAKQSRTRDASRTEFTKHMVRFRKEGSANALVRVGDTFPEVVLVNSHDGSSSYNLLAGLMRLACLNGLIVQAGDMETVRVSHSGDVRDKVIDASYTVLAESIRALESPDKWSRIELTGQEQVAFATAAHTLRFADSEGKVETPITPNQLLHIRRQEDDGRDLWSTFNRVQENVIRGGLSARAHATPQNRRPRLVSTREVKGIDQDVRLNKALWTLGESMANLKVAA